MVSPDSLGTACPLSGRNSTYRLVQISETSSVCCREAFESSGQAEYVDSVSTEDDRLDVPVEYRCWTERKLLQEIAELKAEINRLRGS
jgi:hypothetical protein